MRIEGYYWVKFSGEWEICEWKKVFGDPYFFGIGDERKVDESLIEEIDENRIERPDPEKTLRMVESVQKIMISGGVTLKGDDLCK